VKRPDGFAQEYPWDFDELVRLTGDRETGILTGQQVQQLLTMIPLDHIEEVSQGGGRSASYVASALHKAALNRVFGPGGWSDRVVNMQMVYEHLDPQAQTKNGSVRPAWWVLYRATVEISVRDLLGRPVAIHTGTATKEAQNQPHRGDAHDQAAKSAESLALSRAAHKLGDYFGLSLYHHGSRRPVVGWTFAYPRMATEVPPTPSGEVPPADRVASFEDGGGDYDNGSEGGW
jgi:hypothetical protein